MIDVAGLNVCPNTIAKTLASTTRDGCRKIYKSRGKRRITEKPRDPNTQRKEEIQLPETATVPASADSDSPPHAVT